MSALELTVIDLDLPVGSMKQDATLASGEQQAQLVDVGFTPADSHRLAAAILDSGKNLTTGLRSTPWENTGFAASASDVPAEAVRRPYSGNTPAPTQKGIPQ